jgi:hypothetical protein
MLRFILMLLLARFVEWLLGTPEPKPRKTVRTVTADNLLSGSISSSALLHPVGLSANSPTWSPPINTAWRGPSLGWDRKKSPRRTGWRRYVSRGR